MPIKRTEESNMHLSIQELGYR
uniref:Uncharacterized protein n=1 Tax=Arundo donax TaxID=35708 RepID=A0A0A9FXG2_ARUDO